MGNTYQKRKSVRIFVLEYFKKIYKTKLKIYSLYFKNHLPLIFRVSFFFLEGVASIEKYLTFFVVLSLSYLLSFNAFESLLPSNLPLSLSLTHTHYPQDMQTHSQVMVM